MKLMDLWSKEFPLKKPLKDLRDLKMNSALNNISSISIKKEKIFSDSKISNILNLKKPNLNLKTSENYMVYIPKLLTLFINGKKWSG